jgi:hypothetical protein
MSVSYTVSRFSQAPLDLFRTEKDPLVGMKSNIPFNGRMGHERKIPTTILMISGTTVDFASAIYILGMYVC